MDFRLYARILGRFKVLVAVGFAVAVLAATLTMFSVGAGGISYRDPELWSTKARLGVTQHGFPWGRLYAEVPIDPNDPQAESRNPSDDVPIANPARFNDLAVLYAQLASSDAVRALMRKDGPVVGVIGAQAVRDADSGIMLPLIDLTAISTSPRGASVLATRAIKALETYLEAEQVANNVPTSDRAVLQLVVRPSHAEVFQPRSKTLAVVVFLAIMLATVGLAFLLENLRPRFGEVKQAESAARLPRPARRRTA
jgi:hypothetical protein